MEFMFIGNPNDPTDNVGQIVFRGVRFPLNVPVKVEDPKTVEKLMGNHHFVIRDGGKIHHQVVTPNLVIPKEPGIVMPGAPAKQKRSRKAA